MRKIPYGKERTDLHSDDFDFDARMKDLLLYHRIVFAKITGDQEGILVLDNGTRLEIKGNEGCGGCGNGWYYLQELNACNNAITNVECSDDKETYNIFVYAENQKVKCLEVTGSDNGYYGTGYSVTVSLGDIPELPVSVDVEKYL